MFLNPDHLAKTCFLVDPHPVKVYPFYRNTDNISTKGQPHHEDGIKQEKLFEGRTGPDKDLRMKVPLVLGASLSY